MLNKVIVFSTLTALLSLSSIGCQGNKGEQTDVNVAGNVTTDSQNIFSNSIVNGQSLDLVVSQILVDQFFNNGSNFNSNNGNLRLNLLLNGQQRSLSIFLNNSQIDNFVTDSVGPYQVRTQAVCEGSFCESIFVNLVFISNFGFEGKQIGFFFSRTNRTIRSALEYQGPVGQFLSIASLINQLKSLSGQ